MDPSKDVYSAWLIEIKIDGRAAWYCGGNPLFDEEIWTHDAYKAIHFVRKQDGEAILRENRWRGELREEVKVLDHMFNCGTG
jgi:hypothetical protein